MATNKGVILNTDPSNQNSNDKEWYVVSTYSTHEKAVQDNLIKRVQSYGLQDKIFRIIVPEEEIRILDDNNIPTDKTRKKIIYSGYVFVEMIMTDYAWYIVRNTPGVTGFVGSAGKGTKPFPIPREQIEPVLKRMGMVDESMYERYKEGDYVKIINGPFEGTEGKIISIDKEKNMVVVEATFFGRASTFDVEFSNIEKANIL